MVRDIDYEVSQHPYHHKEDGSLICTCPCQDLAGNLTTKIELPCFTSASLIVDAGLLAQRNQSRDFGAIFTANVSGDSAWRIVSFIDR